MLLVLLGIGAIEAGYTHLTRATFFEQTGLPPAPPH
jgi:cytochrome c oxidase subunit IV